MRKEKNFIPKPKVSSQAKPHGKNHEKPQNKANETESDKAKVMKKKDMKLRIRELFERENKTLNYKQVADFIDVKRRAGKQAVMIVLNELAAEGYLSEVVLGRFRKMNRLSYVNGTVDLTASGSAYIIPDDGGQDIFIAQSNLMNAINGDRVKVHTFAAKAGRRPEGEVVEITERKRDSFVGFIEMSKTYAFVVVDKRILPTDIFIPINKLNGAKNKQKVVARITEWPQAGKPVGEIIDVLGDIGDNNAEMHAILAEFGLPYKYPQNVHDYAEKIDAGITPEEIAKRKDYRNICTFTIDPHDAKDFDDAISFQYLPNGNYEVGVHIADVTHYVPLDSILEEEAFKRATSVYLVDRVVPMLPEHLSNGICSLRPNEEKLCYAATFEIDNEGNVINHWIGRTVIFSDRRFTYEEAQEVIETKKGDLAKELEILNNIAKKIRDQRFKQGAISFERVEVRFNINENGDPLSVYFKESKDSNKLIEEYMLLANKYVAEYVGKQGKSKDNPSEPKTFIYRVHANPDPDKFESFSKFIKKFGYSIMAHGTRSISQSINALLDQVKGKAEQNIIETLAVRTMAKAVYTTKNIGHYGLAFPYYSHFTSPIRRYPDMMVHRLLTRYLDGGKSADMEEYEIKCKHSSEMEQRASDAERASIKYKQVQFMADKVGQDFDAVISGVTEWGFYAEIVENKCEGMVPMRDLDDDYYFFDEENYCIVGRNQNQKYQLGDAVKIRIAKANLDKKQLDFTLAT